jgi:hypothetical protein
VCGGGGEGAGAGAVDGAVSCGHKVRIETELLQKAWGRVRKRSCGAGGLLLLALLSSETKRNLCFYSALNQTKPPLFRSSSPFYMTRECGRRCASAATRSIRRHASHERPLQQLRLARHDANERAAGGAWGEGAGQDGAPEATVQRAGGVGLSTLCSAEVLYGIRLSSRDQRTVVEEITKIVTKPLLYLNLCSNCD